MLRLALVGDNNNGRFMASDANIVVTGVGLSSVVYDDILRDMDIGQSVLVFSEDRKFAKLAYKNGYAGFIYSHVKFMLDDSMMSHDFQNGDRYLASGFLSRVEASEQEETESGDNE